MVAKASELLRAVFVQRSIRAQKRATEAARGGPPVARQQHRAPQATDLSSRFAAGLVMFWQGRRPASEKDRVSYMAQVLGACAIALEYGATEDEAIATLLVHGENPDTGVPTLQEIRKVIGFRPAEIIESLADPYVDAELPPTLREVMYLQYVAESSAAARFVFTAHKLHAARSFLHDIKRDGLAAWCRLPMSIDEFFAYGANLCRDFGASERTPLLDAFSAAMDELHSSARSYSLVRGLHNGDLWPKAHGSHV